MSLFGEATDHELVALDSSCNNQKAVLVEENLREPLDRNMVEWVNYKHSRYNYRTEFQIASHENYGLSYRNRDLLCLHRNLSHH